MSNMLNDDQLGAVSGGAQTETGFEIVGNVVKFRDKNGATMDISMDDYNWLLGKYNLPTKRDQEFALADQKVGDIKSLLMQRPK
ncbi:MAG: hypothetical protein IK139_08000 [Lachnospiraceae bacterium]|nr:hypothetical protein [Lachnospiraceae bacterium]